MQLAPATVERTNEWNGFTKGDPVQLNSPWRGRNRRSRFEFRAHCRSLVTGSVWIEVWGGRSGHPLMRAFPVEAIAEKKSHRRK